MPMTMLEMKYGGQPGYSPGGRRLPSIASRSSTSGVSSATRARVTGLFKEAKAMYAPGGDYMKGIEAQLERGGEKAVATGMQGLAAAGLGGTSMMGGLGLKYEEDVATPARSQATTARLSALSSLLQAEAGATANMATRYSTSPGSYGGGGGGGGGSYTPARTTSTRRPSSRSSMQKPVSGAFNNLFPNLFGGAKASSSGRATGSGVLPRLTRQGDPMNVNRRAGTFSYYNV